MSDSVWYGSTIIFMEDYKTWFIFFIYVDTYNTIYPSYMYIYNIRYGITKKIEMKIVQEL